jgi:hypothetical protein
MHDLEYDKVAVWRRRRDRAKEIRDTEQQTWDKNLLSYQGKLKPKDNIWAEDDPWVSVELVHSTIRSAIPNLLYSNPKFTLTPKRPEIDPDTGEDISWDRARSAELWLQHIWAECEANTHTRSAIISAFLDLGIAKFGFAPTYADDDKRGVIQYDESGSIVIESQTDEGYIIPRLERGEFLLDEDGEYIFDEDTGIAVTHPGCIMREDFFIEWVSARNVLFDPEGGNVLKNHRWIIEEWNRPLSEIRNDPRIAPSIRSEIKSNARIDEYGQLKTGLGEVESIERTGRPEDADDLRVTGFDVYDFVERRYYSIADCDGNEDMNNFFLVDRQIPPGLEHGPLRLLKFNEEPGQVYQKTDAEGMAKLELEYNITRSQLATHRNQSRARYLEVANQGFAGEDGGEVERSKFQSGASGVICRVKNPDGIVPARKDQVGNDFFAAIPNIKDDFREVAGQPGGADTVADADTATQASLLTAQADIRNNDRRDNLVSKFITELARGLLQVASANVTQVQFVKVRKSENDPLPFEFKQINPEDIAGEYDVEVAVGSTQPKNSARQVQLLERMVLLISQNPVIAMVEGLMERMFKAIDINDEKLIKELRALGEAMMGGQQGAQGAPTGPSQVAPDQVQNQNGTFDVSEAGGSPTGAPVN